MGERFGQHEQYIGTHAIERFGQAVTGHAQPARNQRRKFPPKHEDFHRTLPKIAPPRSAGYYVGSMLACQNLHRGYDRIEAAAMPMRNAAEAGMGRHIAIDLGAESGRVMVGDVSALAITLVELH